MVHVFGGGHIPDLHRPHEPAVGVIEDVAVEHPVARTLVEGHEKSGRGVHRDVDGVFPHERTNRRALVVEDDEKEAMQVKRMVPLRVVLHRPQLRLA